MLKEENFKGSIKGKAVALYTMQNKNGIIVQILNFGGKIASIIVPDKNGKMDDIVLGYDNLEGYIKGHAYYGAICGRFANRIADGKFTIDGKTYQLPINNGPNSLHGGTEGFNDKVFDCEGVKQTANGQSLKMTYASPDGEMGYPGTLTLHVTYTLTDNNELRLDYEATTDKATHVNICSHSYFNLAGQGNGDVHGHYLTINADTFTPLTKTQVPTGEFRPVKGTPMDFTTPSLVGKGIDADDEQIKIGAGYDHNWVLNKKPNEMGLAAIYHDPDSGRAMEVYTTQPGVQLYTGNFIDNETGKNGKKYQRRYALCLETQNFPDTPNIPGFPSTLLKPGEVYKQSCVHKFLVKQ